MAVWFGGGNDGLCLYLLRKRDRGRGRRAYGLEQTPRLMEDESQGYCTRGNCAGHGLGVSEGKKIPGHDDGAALFPRSSSVLQGLGESVRSCLSKEER